jgi:hypothetical protein
VGFAELSEAIEERQHGRRRLHDRLHRSTRSASRSRTRRSRFDAVPTGIPPQVGDLDDAVSFRAVPDLAAEDLQDAVQGRARPEPLQPLRCAQVARGPMPVQPPTSPPSRQRRS